MLFSSFVARELQIAVSITLRGHFAVEVVVDRFELAERP